MTRVLFSGGGLVLVAIAFIAAMRVEDTREGLIAEIVTLLAGLAGVGLLLNGIVPRRAGARSVARRISPPATPDAPRSANDLVLGSAGIALALILVGGLAFSGGWMWALLGGVLLIPMIAWSAYLVIAFARATRRDWSIDLSRLFRPRPRA